MSSVILSKLAELGRVPLEAFFPKKYPEARIWRELLGLDKEYEFSKDNFSKILTKLKKEGLVERSSSGRNSMWVITQEGNESLKNRRNIYVSQPDGISRIVMFDIPETERKKRDWLRAELIALDYEPLQKSVWLGYCPLPQMLIDDIKVMKLTNYVYIFSVQKEGTINV